MGSIGNPSFIPADCLEILERNLFLQQPYVLFTKPFPPAVKQLLAEKNQAAFDHILKTEMAGNTKMRWAVEHGCWAFCTTFPYKFLERTEGMSMEKIVKNIQCPVLVCAAASDHFFMGQPELLSSALGERATYCNLTAADAAQEHCHVGASAFSTNKIMDWIGDILA
jgi:hypothetical protein